MLLVIFNRSEEFVEFSGQRNVREQQGDGDGKKDLKLIVGKVGEYSYCGTDRETLR